MKSIVEKINESIDGYDGPKQRVLKKDFEFCTVDEYEDAPEEFDGFEELIEFAKTHGWCKNDCYIIPKGTKIRYEGSDNYDHSEFSIQNGPAKGMSFQIYSDFANEIE